MEPVGGRTANPDLIIFVGVSVTSPLSRSTLAAYDSLAQRKSFP